MKKLFLLAIFLILVVGCSDPITDHNKDVINIINDAKDMQTTNDAKNYIQAVQNHYSEYVGMNGQEPTLAEMHIDYNTNMCNNDPNSPDYALRVVNGYLHIFCNDVSYQRDTMKMRGENE